MPRSNCLGAWLTLNSPLAQRFGKKDQWIDEYTLLHVALGKPRPNLPREEPTAASDRLVRVEVGQG